MTFQWAHNDILMGFLVWAYKKFNSTVNIVLVIVLYHTYEVLHVCLCVTTLLDMHNKQLWFKYFTTKVICNHSHICFCLCLSVVCLFVSLFVWWTYFNLLLQNKSLIQGVTFSWDPIKDDWLTSMSVQNLFWAIT